MDDHNRLDRFHTPSLLVGVVLAVGVLGLMSAQDDSADDSETVGNQAMVEALKALTAAQERQAVAWETLAEKGWPTPQNLTLTGNVPSFLRVGISGSLGVANAGGKFSVNNF